MKAPMLRQITDASRQMFASPKVVERLNATGMTAAYGQPDEVRRMVQKAGAFWGEQVRLTNFQAE